MTPISSSKASSYSAINTSSFAQHKNSGTEKSSCIGWRKNHLEIKPNKNNNNYLRIEVIQKMICRFLTEKKVSKQKLAEALGITVRGLNQLCSKEATQALIQKINLRLVKLYCKTKFW